MKYVPRRGLEPLTFGFIQPMLYIELPRQTI